MSDCARDQCYCDSNTIENLHSQYRQNSSNFYVPFQLSNCEILEKPIFSKKRECCGSVPKFLLYSEDESCEVDRNGFPIINKLF